MSNNSNEQPLHEAYAEMALRILLDEYTKLDVKKLIDDFESSQKANHPLKKIETTANQHSTGTTIHLKLQKWYIKKERIKVGDTSHTSFHH